MPMTADGSCVECAGPVFQRVGALLAVILISITIYGQQGASPLATEGHLGKVHSTAEGTLRQFGEDTEDRRMLYQQRKMLFNQHRYSDAHDGFLDYVSGAET